MVFDKLTRKKIAQAGGRPVGITWPPDAPDPIAGNKYSIQSSATKKGEEKLIVVDAKQTPVGWKVEVRLDADPHRPLVLSCKKGIESDPMGGPQFRAELESERVPAHYERMLAEEAAAESALRRDAHRKQARVLELEGRLAVTRARKMTTAAARVERHLMAVKSEIPDIAA